MKTKQVLVMRRYYLNEKGERFSLRKGKEFAQLSHASNAWLIERIKQASKSVDELGSLNYMLEFSDTEIEWIKGNTAKIVCQVDTENELLEIYMKAQEIVLQVHLIKDNGLTEFKEPTFTCLSIGPDNCEIIDKITSELKLY